MKKLRKRLLLVLVWRFSHGFLNQHPQHRRQAPLAVSILRRDDDRPPPFHENFVERITAGLQAASSNQQQQQHRQRPPRPRTGASEYEQLRLDLLQIERSLDQILERRPRNVPSAAAAAEAAAKPVKKRPSRELNQRLPGGLPNLFSAWRLGGGNEAPPPEPTPQQTKVMLWQDVCRDWQDISLLQTQLESKLQQASDSSQYQTVQQAFDQLQSVCEDLTFFEQALQQQDAIDTLTQLQPATAESKPSKKAITPPSFSSSFKKKKNLPRPSVLGQFWFNLARRQPTSEHRESFISGLWNAVAPMEAKVILSDLTTWPDVNYESYVPARGGPTRAEKDMVKGESAIPPKSTTTVATDIENRELGWSMVSAMKETKSLDFLDSVTLETLEADIMKMMSSDDSFLEFLDTVAGLAEGEDDEQEGEGGETFDATTLGDSTTAPSLAVGERNQVSFFVNEMPIKQDYQDRSGEFTVPPTKQIDPLLSEALGGKTEKEMTPASSVSIGHTVAIPRTTTLTSIVDSNMSDKTIVGDTNIPIMTTAIMTDVEQKQGGKEEHGKEPLESSWSIFWGKKDSIASKRQKQEEAKDEHRSSPWLASWGKMGSVAEKKKEETKEKVKMEPNAWSWSVLGNKKERTSSKTKALLSSDAMDSTLDVVASIGKEVGHSQGTNPEEIILKRELPRKMSPGVNVPEAIMRMKLSTSEQPAQPFSSLQPSLSDTVLAAVESPMDSIYESCDHVKSGDEDEGEGISHAMQSLFQASEALHLVTDSTLPPSSPEMIQQPFATEPRKGRVFDTTLTSLESVNSVAEQRYYHTQSGIEEGLTEDDSEDADAMIILFGNEEIIDGVSTCSIPTLDELENAYVTTDPFDNEQNDISMLGYSLASDLLKFNHACYQLRNTNVVSFAAEGRSRWGDLENARALEKMLEEFSVDPLEEDDAPITEADDSSVFSHGPLVAHERTSKAHDTKPDKDEMRRAASTSRRSNPPIEIDYRGSAAVTEPGTAASTLFSGDVRVVEKIRLPPAVAETPTLRNKKFIPHTEAIADLGLGAPGSSSLGWGEAEPSRLFVVSESGPGASPYLVDRKEQEASSPASGDVLAFAPDTRKGIDEKSDAEFSTRTSSRGRKVPVGTYANDGVTVKEPGAGIPADFGDMQEGRRASPIVLDTGHGLGESSEPDSTVHETYQEWKVPVETYRNNAATESGKATFNYVGDMGQANTSTLLSTLDPSMLGDVSMATEPGSGTSPYAYDMQEAGRSTLGDLSDTQKSAWDSHDVESSARLSSRGWKVPNGAYGSDAAAPREAGSSTSANVDEEVQRSTPTQLDYVSSFVPGTLHRVGERPEAESVNDISSRGWKAPDRTLKNSASAPTEPGKRTLPHVDGMAEAEIFTQAEPTTGPFTIGDIRNGVDDRLEVGSTIRTSARARKVPVGAYREGTTIIPDQGVATSAYLDYLEEAENEFFPLASQEPAPELARSPTQPPPLGDPTTFIPDTENVESETQENESTFRRPSRGRKIPVGTYRESLTATVAELGVGTSSYSDVMTETLTPEQTRKQDIVASFSPPPEKEKDDVVGVLQDISLPSPTRNPIKLPECYQIVKAWATNGFLTPSMNHVYFQLRNCNVAFRAEGGKSRWGKPENYRATHEKNVMMLYICPEPEMTFPQPVPLRLIKKEEPDATSFGSAKLVGTSSSNSKRDSTSYSHDKWKSMSHINNKPDSTSYGDNKPDSTIYSDDKGNSMSYSTNKPDSARHNTPDSTSYSDSKWNSMSYSNNKPDITSYSDNKPDSTSYSDKPDSTPYSDNKPGGTTYTDNKWNSMSYSDNEPDSTTFNSKWNSMIYSDNEPDSASYMDSASYIDNEPGSMSYSDNKWNSMSYVNNKPDSARRSKPGSTSHSDNKLDSTSYGNKKWNSMSYSNKSPDDMNYSDMDPDRASYNKKLEGSFNINKLRNNLTSNDKRSKATSLEELSVPKVQRNRVAFDPTWDQ